MSPIAPAERRVVRVPGTQLRRIERSKIRHRRSMTSRPALHRTSDSIACERESRFSPRCSHKSDLDAPVGEKSSRERTTIIENTAEQPTTHEGHAAPGGHSPGPIYSTSDRPSQPKRPLGPGFTRYLPGGKPRQALGAGVLVDPVVAERRRDRLQRGGQAESRISMSLS